MKSSEPSRWQFFMSGRHRRRGRIWQSLFTGWGLFFTIALLASPFVFQNMTWVILDAINLDSIQQNNMSMTNPKIFGTDKRGNPFSIRAAKAQQRFDDQDTFYFTEPFAEVVRIQKDKKITDKISARQGKFLIGPQKIILSGGVSVKSSDGSGGQANEMEINLQE